MASISRILSKRVDSYGRSEILLRVSVSMNVKHRLKTGVYVKPKYFGERGFVTPRASADDRAAVAAARESLDGIELALINYCNASRSVPTKQELAEVITTAGFSSQPRVLGVFDLFTPFIASKQGLARGTVSHYFVAFRTFYRFVLYSGVTPDVNTLSVDDMHNFVDFINSEVEIAERHPELYKGYPKVLEVGRSYVPRARGRSHMTILTIIRSFFKWLNDQEITDNNPFKKFKIPTPTYGQPVYLSVEERNRLADYDFSAHPKLEQQRDIFIVQCLIGCRVGDLMAFTDDNISNGVLSYIPSKTLNRRGNVVRVPLLPQAQALIARHRGETKGKLLPCVSLCAYNIYIRKAMRMAGLNRVVTIINPKSNQPEQKELWEVGSSHMARRTFVGNLYKRVRDPNLIGSMSGHIEGSKAFARYRSIDDEMKQDIIGLLE